MVHGENEGTVANPDRWEGYDGRLSGTQASRNDGNYLRQFFATSHTLLETWHGPTKPKVGQRIPATDLAIKAPESAPAGKTSGRTRISG